MEAQKQNTPFAHIAFITTLSLLFTSLASRIIYLLMVHSYITPFSAQLSIDETTYHIHHYAFGIIGLSILTFIAFTLKSPAWKYILAALYGIMLGVIYDETQMWLFLTPTNSELISSIVIISIAILFILTGIAAHLISKNKT